MKISKATKWKVDKSKSVFLPPDVRRALGVSVGDYVQFIAVGNGYALIRKSNDGTKDNSN